MTGIAIRIETDDAAIRAVLDGLRARAADLEPAFREIGEAMKLRTQERFELEIDPEGHPWIPSRRARDEAGKTLTDEGWLSTIGYEVDPGQVAWGPVSGPSNAYAAIHQFGGTITAKTSKGLRFKGAGGGWVTKQSVDIPRRAFLGVNEEDGEEILAILRDHLDPAGDLEGTV